MRMYLLSIVIGIVATNVSAQELKDYREFTLAVRDTLTLGIPSTMGGTVTVEAKLILGEPAIPTPAVFDFPLADESKFIRNFVDRIYLNDGSYLKIQGEEIPLTCIFLHGQDNRYSGKDDPLAPDFVLRVTIPANDYSCVGPINPGWPRTSERRELWDTSLSYVVRDPTIMLPADITVQYRRNIFAAYLMDLGN